MTALIFDLDDTLIYQEKTNQELLAETARKLGLPAQDFLDLFHAALSEAYEGLKSLGWCRSIGISAGELMWGDFSTPQPSLRSQSGAEAWKLLQKEVPPFRLTVWSQALNPKGRPGSFTSQQIEGISAAYRQERLKRCTLMPEAREVLEQLSRDYSLAILTNGAPGLQWHKIHQCGLEDLFQVITVSGDWGIGKPDPQIFLKTATLLTQASAQRPERFVMIGNSLNSDIRGAQAAQIPALWLDWEQGTLPPELSPAGIVKTLKEIPAALKNLGL